VDRTKALIETAVRHIVPPGQLEEVVVSTIPDEMPKVNAEPPPASSDARRTTSWWVPVGLVLGAAVGFVLLSFRVLAARRPRPRPAFLRREGQGRYEIGEALDAGPGPAERVRDLIRLNPEAAASVLHRWTGQGGSIG